MAVKPGDVMSAEVKYLGGGSFNLTITDQNTGATFSTIQTSKKADRASAEWIAEGPANNNYPADFGTVNFQSAQATIGGVTGTINNPGWSYDPITMTTSSGIPKATPSALSNSGTAFSVAWESP